LVRRSIKALVPTLSVRLDRRWFVLDCAVRRLALVLNASDTGSVTSSRRGWKLERRYFV
jgi:hypothetical protein